jgi:hypothetical protein
MKKKKPKILTMKFHGKFSPIAACGESFRNWLLKQQFLEFADPSILYHGSDSEKIVGGLYANERDSGWFGSGFYLTAYPDYAQRWGKYIHKMIPPVGKYAEVNATNGYKNIEYVGDAKKANEMAGGTVKWIENEHLWSKMFQSSLKDMGYIGVRVGIDGWKDVEVLVFEPSQIQVLDNQENDNTIR